MLFRHAKLSSNDHSFDPKERAIGGVVLVILMLLFYLLLKAVLGFSGTGREAALSDPFPDGAQNMGSSPAMTAAKRKAGKEVKLKYPLLERFVFLDITGKPMGKEGSSALSAFNADADDASTNEMDGSKNWIVQVASFKKRDRAEKLVEKLRGKDMEATITQSDEWFVVKLEPEKDKAVAQQNLRALRRIGIRGMLYER
jgi:hypothetical protein